MPEPSLIVETDFAKKKIVKAWKGKYQDNIHVSHGFPAPVKGLLQIDELALARKETIENNQPLVLVLPGSGVATAQLESFGRMITQTAQQVSEGKLKIVVQAGAEYLGEKVFESLSTLVNDLDVRYGNIKENVLIHRGKTTEAALDFFEILSGSFLPLVLAVKGSEMSRIAVQLGIPHIATGTIGEHEKWNVIVAALAGAAVMIMPSAYFQCRDLIESSNFPREWYLETRAALDRNYCDDITVALERSRQAIVDGVRADANREMMFETIEGLLKK